VNPSELHSIENLRGIPKGSINNRVHLSAIRKDWNELYRNNPNSSRQDVPDWATKIDDECGDQFDPPVRWGDHMKYYTLAPEVAGELGDDTEMDTTVHPPVVTHLHYEFSDWLGDDLVESFPCFLITAERGEEAASAGLSGFVLADLETSVSPEAEELLDGQQLPPFRWLQLTGQPGTDDFGQTAQARLVVSRRALDLLRRGALENCDVEDYE
jgi:hypothetical protein